MKRRLLQISAVVALLLLLGGGLGLYVLRSDALRERIRATIVEQIERATGARVELAKFDFDWVSWRVWVEGLVLHGKETAEQAPYVEIPRAEISLHIRSWFNKDVDLSRLVIEKPQVHIYVAPDGTTNLPSPKTPPAGDPIARLLKLKIRQLEIRDGVFEYDSDRVPVRVFARDFDALLDWEATPQYLVQFTAGSLALPFLEETSAEGKVLLRAGGLRIERLRINRRSSWIEASGQLEDFKSPRIQASYKGRVVPGDIPRAPLQHGEADIQGNFVLDPKAGWHTTGNLHARGLAYRRKDVDVSGISVDSAYRVELNRLELTSAHVSALGGSWKGRGTLVDWERLQLSGELSGLEIDRVIVAVNAEAPPWSGVIAGPIELTSRVGPNGVSGTVVMANLAVTPEDGQLPASGEVVAEWEQDGNRLNLDTSHLEINETRLNFRGVLGERLEAGVITSSLSDIEPVVRLLSGDRGFALPIDLSQGQARVNTVVEGPLDNPVLRGDADVQNLAYRGVVVESARTKFALDGRSLELTGLRVSKGSTSVRGDLRLPLAAWKLDENAPVAAKLALREGDAEELLKLAGLPPVLKARFSAELDASGTVKAPDAHLRFQGGASELSGEKFDRMSGDLVMKTNGDTRLQGKVQLGQAAMTLNGAFKHAEGDWDDGDIHLEFTEKGLDVSALEVVKAARPGLGGILGLDGSVDVTLRGGKARLDRLGAVASMPDLSLYGETLGSARLEANTMGEAIGTSLALVLDGRRITGSGLIQLDQNYNAEGVLRFPRLPFRLIRLLASDEKSPQPLPFVGFVEGQAVWRAPLATPSRGSARLTITQIQTRPRGETLGETEVATGELVVRNNGPLVLDVDSKSVRIQSARVQAVNTDLALSGQYIFGSRSPWDIAIKGSADLAVASTFHSDLIASGTAAIDGTVRGTPSDPYLSGRVAIRRASFFLRDIPNGIENAEGLILIERNRANIDKLTGESGGGKFEITGFFGVNLDTPTYRLQARAAGIRVRYPEGVSTTIDADLWLTGSANRSLLGGNITVQRAAFNPRSDFASIIGASTQPVGASLGQNEFLRNLQFDVRIRTGPNASVQSSYTQDLEVDADLRLRGSPSKPILLGSLEASQGDINFFGNRYTVSRGEVLFYNVASIQPALNLNLETRIRGVTVFISVTGPLSKLDVSYRSEPPMLSTDIFALLTVGRDPSAQTTTLPSASDPTRNPSSGTGNSLLGGALSSALSSRVEKFFGKSRIKIDPQMTGVENTPQARITIEQSISRDVTLTLVTNVADAQQQIVRLQWDLNRSWQAILVRDENGVFGMDFVYRKRFK